MNNLARFLVTPQPYRDESLKGYLIRLTEANGYLNWNMVCELAGIKKSRDSTNLSMIKDYAIDLTQLSILTGLAV